MHLKNLELSSYDTFFFQSLVCLWMHTAAGVEAMISNGAACLSHLVSVNQNFFHVQVFFFPPDGPFMIYDLMWILGISAYREPYLFVTYFNSLDVIEILGHAALG